MDLAFHLDLSFITALWLVATAFSACSGLLIALLGLQRVFSIAPCLEAAPEVDPPDTSLCVVIPAYNEADNIGPCLSSVLASDPPCLDWQVLVVDDDSTDVTAERATLAASERDVAEPPFELLGA